MRCFFSAERKGFSKVKGISDSKFEIFSPETLFHAGKFIGKWKFMILYQTWNGSGGDCRRMENNTKSCYVGYIQYHGTRNPVALETDSSLRFSSNHVIVLVVTVGAWRIIKNHNMYVYVYIYILVYHVHSCICMCIYVM